MLLVHVPPFSFIGFQYWNDDQDIPLTAGDSFEVPDFTARFFSLNGKIFLRNSYIGLKDVIFNDKNTVSGTPGIGKSVFVL